MARQMDERFFLYVHVNGVQHLKRYADPRDVDEMLESDFVAKLYEVTEAQWIEWKRDPTGPELLAKKLTDGAIQIKETMPDGVIRRLK